MSDLGAERQDGDDVVAGEHLPKLRALRALEGRQLSAAGEARLRVHLDACEVCRRALAGLRLADALIADARAPELELDFARISAGISRSQQVDRRRHTWSVAIGLPLAAAAAAGLVWMATRQVPGESAEAPAVTTPAAPEPPVFAAALTALAGPATLTRADGSTEPLRIDSSLREGDVIQLGPDSLAHLRLDEASGSVLGPASQLALVRVRTGQTRLELRSGRITSRVQPLTAAQAFVVRAADHDVTVHGTHFEVTAVDTALGVTVAEGRVAVRDDTARALVDLHARDHFALDAAFGMRLATRDPSQPVQLERPRALGVPLEEWPLVTLLDVEALESLGLTGLTLDGTRFPVRGELAARVPRGDVTLTVERLTLPPQNIVLHVPAEGLSLAPDALRKLLKPAKPAVRDRDAGEIDFEPVLAVVHDGTGSLQRCYERALKQRPDLDGRLTMRIVVSASGSVRQAQPRGKGAELPDDLVACIRTVSAQWRFPATGSVLTFDVPLRLSPR